MRNWITPHQEDGPDSGDTSQNLNSRIRELELELAEREAVIKRLQAELENQRAGQKDQLSDQLRGELEPLFAAAAAPAVQLLTQAYLLEEKGRPVQARDVLLVARRLLRALQDRGLEISGRPGEIVAFDSNSHAPLNAANPLIAGEQVCIRIPGAAYRGKNLVKAGVEREGESQ